MSADRRKTILYTFGGLAVVLIAILAVVRPTFRSDEATGAIGAVQKHHQPQITKADVVLGGEQVKQEQKVLFADYLADAKDLKSFSLAVRNEDLRVRVEAKAQGVRTRFDNDFELALGLAKQLGNDEALSAGVRQQAFARIAGLEAKASAASRTTGYRAELANEFSDVANTLGRAAQVNVKSMEMKTIGDAEMVLGAIDRNNLAMQLRAQADYLGMMAKQSHILESEALSMQSGAALKSETFALELNQMAADLQARATKNAHDSLAAASDEAAALGKMSQVASRADAGDRARADLLNRGVANRFAGVQANLNAMSVANRSYASMLGDSEAFSTQVKALQDEVMSLGAHAR